MSNQQPPQDPQQPIDPVTGQPYVQPPPPLYPPAPPPGQPYGAPINQPAPSQFPATPGYGAVAPAAMPQTNTTAIIAFVLSIASWMICPIIAAIVALVFASKAKKEIEQSGGWQTGSGFVTAAKVISWINIVVMALFIAFYVVFIVILIATGEVNNPDTFTSAFPTPFSTPSGLPG
ncbi:MAG: DUF4190 domain-containing protein [Actinobacteria bacterium]|nr:DUF4190 domain-containing protein [Actinomycetota bacterium]